MSNFFIKRPIVAMVVAIITVIVGAASIARLPVSQFPNIVPPEIQLLAPTWAQMHRRLNNRSRRRSNSKSMASIG